MGGGQAEGYGVQGDTRSGVRGDTGKTGVQGDSRSRETQERQGSRENKLVGDGGEGRLGG